MQKTIIITGINGQLGQFLVKYLQENQPDVKIIGTIRHKSYDNQPYIFDKNSITIELMDLSDYNSVENLILKYKPTFFVNTAANAYVGESWNLPVQHMEINAIGVLHQLEAIRKHSCHTRYFNMGSSEELGNDLNDNKTQNEKTVINPKSPYGCSKAAARYLVNVYRNSYNLYAIQGITFNFESELRGVKYLPKKVTIGVARIKKAIENNKSFEPIDLGNLYSHRSWQFCGDVADAIWRMLNQENYNEELRNKVAIFRYSHPDGGAIIGPNVDIYYKDLYSLLSKNIKHYVVSSSECRTVKEFVELSFKYAGINGFWSGEGLNEQFLLPETLEYFYNLKSRVLVKINPIFLRPHDVTYLNGDSSLIQKELGWKSTLSFEDLVKRMTLYELNQN